MLFNYHTHSQYCDGVGSLESIIIEAINKNFTSLGFSSHAPFAYPTKWAMKNENLSNYLAEIDSLKLKYNNKINIYKGLEIDFIPNVINTNNFSKYNLDYTIGSVHYINKYNGIYWGIDDTKEIFEEGLKNVFNNNIKEVVKEYYNLVKEMVLTSPPDIIGHFDIIKKNNKGNVFFNEYDKWYKDEVLSAIGIIKKSNCIVEINTRGILTKRVESLYPDIWILKELSKNNIPLTISSDSHKKEQLNGYFIETLKILNDIGIKELFFIDNGKWIAKTI